MSPYWPTLEDAMKKLAKVSKARRLAADRKGAALVEYSLMVLMITAGVAPMLKGLGQAARTSIVAAADAFVH